MAFLILIGIFVIILLAGVEYTFLILAGAWIIFLYPIPAILLFALLVFLKLKGKDFKYYVQKRLSNRRRR